MSIRLPPRPAVVVAVLILLLTLAAYGGLRRNGFITLDDGDYITNNTLVNQGLTRQGVGWAFTTGHAGNWHPLTWLSHMLDAELFGTDAGAHHLVSLALHALNALLLLALLHALTGALLQSALVAAVFALHPQHVESVAWAAERKDVLSLFFSLAAALAYVRAARRNAVLRSWSTPLLLALALMAKPMPVTLPLLFLLLDGWPLGRWGVRAGAARGARLPPPRLWLEKTPLLLLALASSVATLRAQSPGITAGVPPLHMVANALLAAVHYLGKIVWPAGLSAFYPYTSPKLLPAVGAGTVLAALTALALVAHRRLPFLATGWFWFLGTLVPVLGFVKVGSQAWADRYAYLPAIGISVALAWAAAAALKRRRSLAPWAAAAVACTLLLLAARTRAQVALWKDDLTLFTHALEVDPDNWVAHNSIGVQLLSAGGRREAVEHFEKALAIMPGYFDALMNLGSVLADAGRRREAERHLRAALELNPASPSAHSGLGSLLVSTGRAEEGLRHLFRAVELDPLLDPPRVSLGTALIRAGRPAEAIPQFAAALRVNPGNTGVYSNLGYALHLTGRNQEALAYLQVALERNPSFSEAYNNRGLALAALGRHAEAQAAYRSAIRHQPWQAEPHFNLGLSLASQRDFAGASEQFRETVRITPGDAEAWQSLARTLAAAGRMAEAAAAAERGASLAPRRR